MGIAERLREERGRLGLSQADFAAAGGAHRKSQGNYESGERFPDAAYLAAIASIGADVLYIVTGIRSDTALTPDERELVALFRSASLSVKSAAVGALKGGGAKISIGGSVTGQVAEGGLVNHGDVSIGVRRKKK